MQTTKKLNLVRANKRLWLWCAENPDKGKEDWHEWEKNGGEIADTNDDCSICSICNAEERECENCLINWGKNHTGCCSACSPYLAWSHSRLTNKVKYALQIAALHDPVIEKLERELNEQNS